MPIIITGTPVSSDVLEIMGFSLTSDATSDVFQLNAETSTLFVDLDTIEGLDMPDIKTEQHDKASTHGAYVNSSWLGSRMFNLEGTAYATSASQLQTLLDRLKTIWQPTPTPGMLHFRVPAANSGDQYRRIEGYSQGMKYAIEAALFPTRADVQFQFLCPDPFILNESSDSQTLSVTPTGGGTFNLSVAVGGTAPGGAILRLVIPTGNTVTNPKFTRTTLFPSESTAPSIELAGTFTAGTIEINLRDRTCRHTTSAGVVTNLRGTWQVNSRWFLLVNGNTNVIQFSKTSSAGSSSPSVTVEAETSWW